MNTKHIIHLIAIGALMPALIFITALTRAEETTPTDDRVAVEEQPRDAIAPENPDSAESDKLPDADAGKAAEKIEGEATPVEKDVPENPPAVIDENKPEENAVPEEKPALGVKEELPPVGNEAPVVEEKAVVEEKKEGVATEAQRHRERTGEEEKNGVADSAALPSTHLFGAPLGDTVFLFYYGMMSPMNAYGDIYGSAGSMGGGVQFGDLGLWGIAPELHFAAATLESGARPGRAGSTMGLLQVMGGLSYTYYMPMPRFARNWGVEGPLSLFVRATDGVTRTSFESDAAEGAIVEYIHTFGFSAGAAYPVFRGVYLGVEGGWQYIATAGEALQSTRVLVNVGIRL